VDLDNLIADAKSGVSGAGRKAEVHTLFSEASDNFKAYGVAGHRHQPEIRQNLAAVAKGVVGLTFVPHNASVISSTRRTETPARYISIRASSTDASRRR